MTTATPDVDVVVIGAGAVGLSCAASLTRRGREVWVLEAEAAIGQGVTSRNSEVVHAGIYYPAGSLKARLCTAGREALYRRCVEWRVPHRKLGKLIVATQDAELASLEDLRARGEANGVPGLELLDADRAQRLEPDVRCRGALLSPETGIVDGHALCLSFLAEAEAGGSSLLLRTRVCGVERAAEGWVVDAVTADGERQSVSCAAVVDAAGLASDVVAGWAGLDVDARSERLHPCKGDYFTLAPGAPIRLSRLIYPVPAGPGLGIHATLDLGDRIRFGPDAEFVDEPHYDVDPGKARAFADAIRRYLPAIRAEWLAPDYAGVRPRLAGPGEAPRDFVVREESDAGLPGFVSCIGIESPGLTAAPAIGEHVAELLAGL